MTSLPLAYVTPGSDPLGAVDPDAVGAADVAAAVVADVGAAELAASLIAEVIAAVLRVAEAVARDVSPESAVVAA